MPTGAEAASPSASDAPRRHAATHDLPPSPARHRPHRRAQGQPVPPQHRLADLPADVGVVLAVLVAAGVVDGGQGKGRSAGHAAEHGAAGRRKRTWRGYRLSALCGVMFV